MSETKRERFVRIAGARTNKIISMIKLLSNCSNLGNYDYSDEDVKKIFNALEKELKIAKIRFSETNSKDEKFKL